MDMEKIKAEVMLILDKFVAFLHDLVNKFLGEVEIDIFA